MDPHFHEYLAAVAAMHECYGAPGDETESDFHATPPAADVAVACVAG